MQDKPYRSVVKSITWRVTGTLDTMIITFLVTGKLRFALTVGAIELFTKMFLYYLHERIWNRVSFGRVKNQPEYTI